MRSTADISLGESENQGFQQFPVQENNWYKYKPQLVGEEVFEMECNNAYNLSIQFPEPIEDFDARIHLEKLMACVYDSSKEVVQVKDFEEISEVWGCEIKVPEEAAMVIVVMVFKNGSKQALLNYKLK